MSGQTRSRGGPARPHMALVRAVYDWSLDQGFTPQVLVDVTVPGVEIPGDYAREGKIVLNIHPNAVRDLEFADGYLLFSARFSGRPENIAIPVESVVAAYAGENGQGVVFQSDGTGIVPPPRETGHGEGKAAPPGGRAPGHRLKVVK